MSPLFKRLVMSAAFALVLVCTVPDAHAELVKQNLVQLIESSQSIVSGTVTNVSDGIDANGVPYTEVTIAVGASPKGSIGTGDYTFRQFGLTKPRTMANGQRMLMVTPAEFPRWHQNEFVVAFLYHPAARTGLQTTVGLAQGKLVMVNHELSNKFRNAGLFDGIKATPGTLTTAEAKLLTSKGPVKATTLMSLIKHIVNDKMIQRGTIK